MKYTCIKINQTNMYCQKCFNNVIRAISKIEKIIFLDINMSAKSIKLIYRDSSFDKDDICYLIDKAIKTGQV